MLEPIPTLNIYRNRSDSSEIVLLHTGPQYISKDGREIYFANIGYGQFARFGATEFAETGFSIVKKSLQTFHTRKLLPGHALCELDQLTAKRRREFDLNHLWIHIALEPTGCLRLDKVFVRRAGKSASSGRVKERFVSLDDTPQEFFDMLNEMFMLGEA